MKKSKKSNKNKKKFVDEISRFSKHENLKIGDIVVYKRYSDKKKSVGEIKWFCKSVEGMCASMIDLNLGNFQIGICSEIEEEAPQSLIRKLIQKKALEKKENKANKSKKV